MICCLQSKGTHISSRKQDDFVGLRSIRSSTSGRWLEKSGKHVGPNFTLKPSTKASSLQFGETEIFTNLGGKKERNKRQIYGLLVNARDVCRWTIQVEPMEKRKTGKKRWLRFRWSYVYFLFARTLFSGLYRWRTSIRTIFFSINAGAIEWRTLKLSTTYSADSVSRPHIISASNFPISYLWLLRVLTSCSIIF